MVNKKIRADRIFRDLKVIDVVLNGIINLLILENH